MLKLHCLSAAVIAAFLTCLSVFIAEVGKTEYKSQVRKRKAKKSELVLDNTNTDTRENVEAI